MRNFLQTHLQEPEFFFWFTSDVFCKNPISSYQDSYVNFYKEIYKQRWYRKRTTYPISGGVTQRVPQAYLQANSTLTPHHEQKPQEPWRTRWPQEKGRWAISPNSGASHPLHSYAVGYYSRSKYDIPRDWLQEACHMARVRWETRCKGFGSKEGPHYRIERIARNQPECNQVQRALEKSSGSCCQTSNNQPYSQGWKSLGDSSPRLYCFDLAEAYVMQENASLRI
jgi:hypothetical protein